MVELHDFCFDMLHKMLYNNGDFDKKSQKIIVEEDKMKHIKTISTRNLKESMNKGGCGECQTSCQSACKTSCTVGNQSCEQIKK